MAGIGVEKGKAWLHGVLQFSCLPLRSWLQTIPPEPTSAVLSLSFTNLLLRTNLSFLWKKCWFYKGKITHNQTQLNTVVLARSQAAALPASSQLAAPALARWLLPGRATSASVPQLPHLKSTHNSGIYPMEIKVKCVHRVQCWEWFWPKVHAV